jgi:hypothetical protein
MSDENCTGCEYHADCASAIAWSMGWIVPWFPVENGTEQKPHCRTWQSRHAEEATGD